MSQFPVADIDGLPSILGDGWTRIEKILFSFCSTPKFAIRVGARRANLKEAVAICNPLPPLGIYHRVCPAGPARQQWNIGHAIYSIAFYSIDELGEWIE